MQSPPSPPEEPPGGWGLYLPPGVDPRTQAETVPTPGRNDPMASAALALGIASLITNLCCGAFSLVLNLAGLVLAILSFRKATKDPAQTSNRGLPLAALIVNGVLLILNIALSAFFLLGMFGSSLFP